jgi:hypothetical protein
MGLLSDWSEFRPGRYFQTQGSSKFSKVPAQLFSQGKNQEGKTAFHISRYRSCLRLEPHFERSGLANRTAQVHQKDGRIAWSQSSHRWHQNVQRSSSLPTRAQRYQRLLRHHVRLLRKGPLLPSGRSHLGVQIRYLTAFLDKEGSGRGLLQ